MYQICDHVLPIITDMMNIRVTRSLFPSRVLSVLETKFGIECRDFHLE